MMINCIADPHLLTRLQISLIVQTRHLFSLYAANKVSALATSEFKVSLSVKLP